MAYIYDLTDTWSAAGTVFNGIKLNVTNTASASGSKLVTLQIGGTEHFSVTKDGVGYFSGNVGIGTSSPLAGFRLDVSGSANASGSFISGGGTTNQAQIGNKVLLFYNTSVGEGLIQSADDASTFNSMGIDKTTLRFLTNNSERMRIDSSGNVGIGTSSPERLLDAAGTARFRGDVDMFASVGGAVNSIFQYFGSAALPRAAAIYSKTDTATAGNLVLATSQSGTGTITERMRIDSVGNVGIGTSSPGAKFDVNGGSANTEVRFNYADNTVGRTVTLRMASTSNPSYTGAGAYVQAIQGAGVDVYSLAFGTTQGSTSATERMRIDSSGNLLVGTTSNSLSGTATTFVVNYSGGATHGCNFNQTVSSATYYTQIAFSTAGTVVGEIRSNNTATQYSTSSDVRLKHDIIDAPEASSLIDAIQVRSFKWNADNSEQRYGFVAQELVTVAPEAVSQPENPEEMMGVDYSKLVPMLVKELQSLRARVAQLEGN